MAAVDLPVSADLENGFADDPDEVATTVRLALNAGLAGCSIEDFTRRPDDPIYELDAARDRVIAAAEVAHGGDVHLVLTARAENYLHGRPDLADTITRLQAYQDAGADVLYAPGLTDLGRHPAGRGERRPPGQRPGPARASQRWPSWLRPVFGASRWARPSPGWPSGPSSTPGRELLDAGHLRLLGPGRQGRQRRPECVHDPGSGPVTMAMTDRRSPRWCSTSCAVLRPSQARSRSAVTG